MLLFGLTGAVGAGRLAEKLLTKAVTLSLTTEAVTAGLARTTEGIITPLLREEAPERTGALRASLRGRVRAEGGHFVVTVESDVPYLPYVVDGTGIYAGHDAWDVQGLQVFVIEGRTIFTMHTHHVGQKPNPFPERALLRAQPPIRAAMTLAGREILVSFARA